MPEKTANYIGQEHISKSGDKWYYRELPDGQKGWSPERPTEEEIIAGSRGRGNLGGTSSDKERAKIVSEARESGLSNLALDTAISVGGDIATLGTHRLIPKGVEREGVKKGAAFLAQKLSGLTGGYLGGEAAAAAMGRDDSDVMLRTGLDRALGYGINYGMGKVGNAASVFKDEWNAPTGSPYQSTKNIASELLPHPAKVLHEKLLKRALRNAPPTPSQVKDLGDVVEFADNFNLPAVTAGGLFNADPRMAGDIKRSGLGKSIQEGQDSVVRDLLGTKSAEILNTGSNYERAKLVQDTHRTYRKERKAELSRKFDDFDKMMDQTAITVPIAYTAVNPVTGNPYQSHKTVTITGPVDITPSIQEMEPLSQAIAVLESQGNLIGESGRHASKLKSLFDNLSNTPKINDRSIADYNTVKEIRAELSDFVNSIPSANTHKAQISGVAAKLRASLSKDTDTSLMDQSIYDPQTQAKYAEVKAFTKENAGILKSKLALGAAANEDSPNQVTGKQFDKNPETLVMNAIKSGRNGLDNLAVMLPPGDRDLAGAIYMKHGLDQALDPKTGLYDSTRLNNFFFGSNGVGAGALESNVFTSHQRKTVRQFVKYMQTHEALANPSSGGSALENTAIKGMVYAGTAGVGKLMGHTFGAGGAVGGALAAGIPITRNFLEDVLMDPEGGKKILNYIHAPTARAKANNLRDLIEFTIRNGAKVVLRAPDGQEVEKN